MQEQLFSHPLVHVKQGTQRCSRACWGNGEAHGSRWRGHIGQGFRNQRRMDRIEDSHKGCQHIKLQLLNGTQSHSAVTGLRKSQPNKSPCKLGRILSWKSQYDGVHSLSEAVRPQKVEMIESTKGRWLVKTRVFAGNIRGFWSLPVSVPWANFLPHYVCCLPIVLKTKALLFWRVNHWESGVRDKPLRMTFFLL